MNEEYNEFNSLDGVYKFDKDIIDFKNALINIFEYYLMRNCPEKLPLLEKN